MKKKQGNELSLRANQLKSEVANFHTQYVTEKVNAQSQVEHYDLEGMHKGYKRLEKSEKLKA